MSTNKEFLLFQIILPVSLEILFSNKKKRNQSKYFKISIRLSIAVYSIFVIFITLLFTTI